MDIACCIIQMRQNKLGRLRKYHGDGLVSQNVSESSGKVIDRDWKGDCWLYARV